MPESEATIKSPPATPEPTTGKSSGKAHKNQPILTQIGAMTVLDSRLQQPKRPDHPGPQRIFTPGSPNTACKTQRHTRDGQLAYWAAASAGTAEL